MKRERRTIQGVELRAGDNGSIGGHAAVFNQEYVLYDSPSYRIVETIKPGTFTRALNEKQDVRCLFNHNSDNILGRTSAGTLKLEQDSSGLKFDNSMPDTQLGRDIRTSIQRKDITGCSFAFIVTKQNRTEEDVNGKTFVRREIQDLDLFDVGPVTYPAYEGTDVGARSAHTLAELRGFFGDELPSKIASELRVQSTPDDEVPDGDGDEGAGDDVEECECNCRACFSAECNECGMHMESCMDSENCGAQMAARAKRDDKKKTKRVDGEDLPASAFLYVADPDKTATWSLPVKFSTEAKTKSHIQNALARFEQTKNIPTDKKAAVYKKLVALAKQHGIHVAGESNSADPVIDVRELARLKTETLLAEASL